MRARPRAATKASSDRAPTGSAMEVAPQGERSLMPFGMFRRQNDIGSPKTRV